MTAYKSYQIEPIHITLRDAIAISGFSRSGIYKAIRDGRLKAFKEASRLMIGFASLKQTVQERKPAIIGAGSETFTASRKRGIEKSNRRKLSAKRRRRTRIVKTVTQISAQASQ